MDNTNKKSALDLHELEQIQYAENNKMIDLIARIRKIENLNSILTHDFNQMLQQNAVLERERERAVSSGIALQARFIESLEIVEHERSESVARVHELEEDLHHKDRLHDKKMEECATLRERAERAEGERNEALATIERVRELLPPHITCDI